jgi:hypothetical protein
MLISKIILKNKNIILMHLNIKKHFKKQSQPYSQTIPQLLQKISHELGVESLRLH